MKRRNFFTSLLGFFALPKIVEASKPKPKLKLKAVVHDSCIWEYDGQNVQQMSKDEWYELVEAEFRKANNAAWEKQLVVDSTQLHSKCDFGLARFLNKVKTK